MTDASDDGVPGSRVCAVVSAGAAVTGRQGLSYAPAVSSETVGSRALHMQIVTIPPGGRAKPHRHDGHETAVHIVSGRSGMWWGDALEMHVVGGPGDFMFIPSGVPHQPYNLSDTEPCVAVIARTDPNREESVVLLPHLDGVHPGPEPMAAVQPDGPARQDTPRAARTP